MRLLNFGTGEVTDRLTILSMKILYGAEAGKETKHFEDERSGLLAKLAGQTLNGSWFRPTLELAAVNAAIWRLEDELRALRNLRFGKTTAEDVVRVAFRLQELNDQRAQLVDAINTLTGTKLGSEKLT